MNIVAIYKNKGDKSISSNSREIALLSVAGKVEAKVMLQGLINTITEPMLPESQCGFRKNRSTDMIFTTRQLQEKRWKQHQDLFVAFIDLPKAFDIVNRELLWNVFAKFGCPAKFVNILQYDGSCDHWRARLGIFPCTQRGRTKVCVGT